MKKLVIVSEIFYPAQTSTGFYLTAIAAQLARHFELEVLSSWPAKKTTFGDRRDLRAVRIARVGRMNSSDAALPRRIVGAAVRGMLMFAWLVRRLRRGDIVLALTNPPVLPPLAAMACALRGAHLVILTHDLYPQAAVAAGILKAGSAANRGWESIQRWAYGRAKRNICLGRDMRQTILRLNRSTSERVVVIPNWAEVGSIRMMTKAESIFARQNGAMNRFVVLYAGNLGRTHDPELILRASLLARNEEGILFLIAASGSQCKRFEAEVKKHPPGNLSVVALPSQRDRQSDTLAAADVILITLQRGMAGVSVPSRMYNAMAAGKPLIAVAEDSSELARVVREEDIGWVTQPGDSQALWEAIAEARLRPDILGRMGCRARAVAETIYAEGKILRQYTDLLLTVSAEASSQS